MSAVISIICTVCITPITLLRERIYLQTQHTSSADSTAKQYTDLSELPSSAASKSQLRRNSSPSSSYHPHVLFPSSEQERERILHPLQWLLVRGARMTFAYPGFYLLKIFTARHTVDSVCDKFLPPRLYCISASGGLLNDLCVLS